MKPSHTTTPSTLNSTCTRAARTASRGLPMEASIAVTQVPMFAPNASAMPVGRVMKPWLAITITIPVVADDDWTRPVKAAATRIPTSGVSMVVMRSRKGW